MYLKEIPCINKVTMHASEENARGRTSREMLEVKRARGDRLHFSDGMGFYMLL